MFNIRSCEIFDSCFCLLFKPENTFYSMFAITLSAKHAFVEYISRKRKRTCFSKRSILILYTPLDTQSLQACVRQRKDSERRHLKLPTAEKRNNLYPTFRRGKIQSAVEKYMKHRAVLSPFSFFLHQHPPQLPSNADPLLWLNASKVSVAFETQSDPFSVLSLTPAKPFSNQIPPQYRRMWTHCLVAKCFRK